MTCLLLAPCLATPRSVSVLGGLLERAPALDIEACFPSIRHDLVLSVLRPIVRDRALRELCAVLLRGPAGQDRKGRGLPIGDLTSQWFSNLVLDRLDHHVKRRLRVPGYVRYMDDFVLFDDDKASLRRAHAEVARFVEDELDLRLKPRATRLAPARCGLPFLGVRLYRATTRVRPENLRRIRRRLKKRRRQLDQGAISETDFVASVASVFAHLEQTGSRGLRAQLARRLDVDPT